MHTEHEKLSILYEIALTVSQSLNLNSILDDALQKVITFMGVDSGVIYVINDVTLEMHPISFRNLSDEVIKDLTLNRVKVGECMCGTIAQCDREVVINEKASLDPRFTRHSLKREGMEFYAGLPLKSKGKVVGVICAITHAPYKPEEGVLDILRAATVPIGLAIENSLLFKDAKMKADERSRYIDFEGIIASSPNMKEVLHTVRKVLDVPSNILIYGESGTGKELIARSIHYNSLRGPQPFIAVNCAAIPESLLESELFGYVKGAFTGAMADKKGLLEAANRGTLFLDEVEAMSKALQVKLLRVFQDRTFFKVGSTIPLTIDLRIIAATNKDLEEAIKAKEFREDLFYRLNVIKISLPPIRKRTADIPLLIRYFIARFNEKMDKGVRKVSEDALDILLNYEWPGNVREMENVIERAVVMTETKEIRVEDLPPEIMKTHYHSNDLSLESLEKERILEVLKLVEGNKRKASRVLGVDPVTLWRKLKKFGLMT